MNFNETVPFLLAQISTYFRVVIEKQLNKFNLHGGQIFILFALWKIDGMSQIELSTNLGVSPPTINKMVRSLKNNGFVACAHCPRDGRIMRVFLTPKGVAIRPTVEEEWTKIEGKLISNLTATEQLVLFQLFQKIGDNLVTEKASVF